MKSWMFEKLIAATVATLLLTFLSSCGPESKNLSAYQKSSTTESANIIGGVNATLDYQKQNGIVGLVISEYIALGIHKKTGKIILARDENGALITRESICSGTLIDKKIVLTAAHCVASQFIAKAAVFFTENMFADLAPESTKPIAVVDFAINENYLKGIDLKAPSDSATWNDIALVKLGSDAPADFKFARLPASANEVNLLAGSKVTLAGFGIINAIVRKIKLGGNKKPVIINKVVQTVDVPSVGSGVLRKVDGINVVAVTADQREILLDQRNLKGACHGDSGGPAFVVAADGSLVQVGVTSRGTEQLGNCTQGAIYSGVAAYLDWIKNASAELNKVAVEPIVAAIK